MNKNIRIVALCLAASMMISLAACRPQGQETTATSETTTEATTTTSAASETTKESETSATSDDNGLPLKGCKIEFKPEDQRYHYDMDLKLDTSRKTIGGHVVFDFYNDSAADWDKLCLRDYPSLYKNPKNVGYDAGVKTHGEITEITNITDGRNNGKIEMTRDEDVSVVWLPLATALKPGEKMTLSYDFVATIPTVADRYGYQDGVYNVTNFYPILAEYTADGWSHAGFSSVGECFYSEISDYDVRLTVPEDMVVLSTGLENGENKRSDSKTITIHADCVRDFVFSCSEDFEVVEGDYKDTHIRVAYTEEDYPEYYGKTAEVYLKASIDSLRIFGEAFGEYPYKDLEVIIAPIAAGGMEYPNLIIITKDSYAAEEDEESQDQIIQLEADNVVSHEIGHQWFMGIVGSNSGMQPWLDESFASYTEYVYDVGVYPDKSDNERLPITFKDDSSDEEWKANMTESGYIPINRPYYDFDNQFVYITAVYSMGKDLLIDMEKAVGREDFYAIIREYVQENAFRNADQSDFFRVLYKYAGTDNKELNSLTFKYLDDKGQAPAA